MYGRGATDMKSGVAAFVAAAVDFVRETPPDGAVILAITGDEEGEARTAPWPCWTGWPSRASG
jgi:succinyl-diaminopimelate desuccinylase